MDREGAPDDLHPRGDGGTREPLQGSSWLTALFAVSALALLALALALTGHL
jgi:hypothetical protein